MHDDLGRSCEAGTRLYYEIAHSDGAGGGWRDWGPLCALMLMHDAVRFSFVFSWLFTHMLYLTVEFEQQELIKLPRLLHSHFSHSVENWSSRDPMLGRECSDNGLTVVTQI